jgi:transposase
MTTADLPTLSADDGPVSPRADRPVRRVFTAEYKLAVLAEYDAAEPGEKGAILRREGLYSSHVVDWRRARDAGALAGLGAAPRPRSHHPNQVETARLRARAERAERELAKTRAALEIVGKAHALPKKLRHPSPAIVKTLPLSRAGVHAYATPVDGSLAWSLRCCTGLCRTPRCHSVKIVRSTRKPSVKALRLLTPWMRGCSTLGTP